MTILRLAALCAILLSAQLNPALAGDIKNAQNILGGVLTRAGVSGQAQLSDSQLYSLCEKGYSQAFFLYRGATPRSVSCSRGRISYRSILWTDPSPVLQAVNAGLQGGGKVFVHCNNGAHASGFIAAVALRQFCRYSADEAIHYWGKTNSYGIPPGISRIKRTLNGFSPQSGMAASSSCR